ncbi:MAG: hypothetical protein GY754_41505 [bacterium]|nr:hypothetical protein [bacterium]
MNEASTQLIHPVFLIFGIMFLLLVLFVVILIMGIKIGSKNRQELLKKMTGPIFYTGLVLGGKIEGRRYYIIPFKLLISSDNVLVKNVLIKIKEIKKMEIKSDLLRRALFIEYSINGISQPIMILQAEEVKLIRNLIERNRPKNSD